MGHTQVGSVKCKEVGRERGWEGHLQGEPLELSSFPSKLVSLQWKEEVLAITHEKSRKQCTCWGRWGHLLGALRMTWRVFLEVRWLELTLRKMEKRSSSFLSQVPMFCLEILDTQCPKAQGFLSTWTSYWSILPKSVLAMFLFQNFHDP